MKSGIQKLSLLGVGALSVVAFGATIAHRGAPAGTAGRTPVIVELFTSEGCDSCPSAEALVEALQARQPDPDALIIPLTEHVDYFNSAAWTDPFSSPRFTQRQMSYVGVMKLKEPYTPQMVVDGRTELLGSNGPGAISAIHRAAQRHKAKVTITPSDLDDKSVNVKVTADDFPAIPAGETAYVTLVVAEDKLSSDVKGGENNGRHLPHTAVARSFTHVGEVKRGEPFSQATKVTLAPGWNRAHLSIVAFVQEHTSGHILGAAIVPLTR